METTTCAVFCALCRSLFDDIKIQNAQGGKLRRNHWSYQTFHESNAALRESLRLGCSLCTALDYDTTSFKRDEVNVKDQDNCVELNFQFLTDLDGGRPNDTSSSNKRNFVLFKVHVDRRLFSLHQAAYAATNAGDHRVLSLVHEWMTRCRDHHVQCPWTQHPPRYPTRVLDVEEDVIRLVESWNHRLFGPYATLSHSWGKTRVKILTKETLPDFQQGFHIYDIPPTFRDAIHVVRRLNVRYLWIDCYCILQSDDGRNEDQQHEIAEMEEIYSNSIINIGADVATSPMDGCFVTRSPIPRIHIDFTSAPTFRADEYLLFDKKPLDAVCSDFSNPHASSVFGRAWCLQERFLCPRMVHFARSGVFWECDQIEFTSDILPFEYIYSRPRLPPFSFGSKIILRHFSSFSDQWRQILNYYTGMELSRPTEDKLAACGGIAKRIANLMGDEYIAGFFRRNLVPSLAWTVRTNIGQRAKRTKTWRAPSWSWASMDGSLWFSGPPREADECATLVSIDCKPVDPSNPYGALDYATITLKGWAVDVSFEEVDASQIRYGKDMVTVQWGPCKATIEMGLDDLNGATGDFELLFTYIYRTPGMSGQGRKALGKEGQGLVLKASGQRYVRVGAFDSVIPEDMVPAIKERLVTIE